jgi:hypothetical protein
MRLLVITAALLLLPACSRTVIEEAVPSTALPAANTNSPAADFTGQWEGEAETERWPLFLHLEIDGAGPGAGRLKVLGQDITIDLVEAAELSLSIRIGEGTDAILLTGAFDNEVFEGRLLQGDTSYPFRLRKVPRYPEPSDRTQAWGQDIDALLTRFLPADRSFTPAERAKFAEALDDTRNNLANLNDTQVTTRIAAAIALANNAHTRLYLLRNRTEMRRLPVRLWWFEDGLYVLRSTAEYQNLLGCRIDAIEGVSARHARDRVGHLFAGNPSWRDYKSVYALTSPETLHGVGISPGVGPVKFSVSGCAASGSAIVAPLPLDKSDKPVEAWWDLSPSFNVAEPGWRHVLEAGRVPLPLYLRNMDNYRFEYLPEKRLLYFQYNRSQDMPGTDTVAFGRQLIAELAHRKPAVFVLDLRFNTGGNLHLADELMKDLIERTKGMRRYVITGRATFSAGIANAVTWREAGNVTFVGEPVGDELEMWAEGGNIILPNSGLYAHFANGLHSYSPGPCPRSITCLDRNVEELGPDIPVHMNWSDYQSGRDPALEQIIREIGEPR